MTVATHLNLTRTPHWPGVLAAVRRHLDRFHRIPVPVRDELAQEAVARALGVSDIVAPSALTRRIAHNLAISWLRRLREERLPDGREVGSGAWQTQIDARIDVERVFAVLDGAPSAYRDVVRRCFLEDVDVDTLIDEERVLGEARSRVQDRIYKRRARGLAWARRHLEA